MKTLILTGVMVIGMAASAGAQGAPVSMSTNSPSFTGAARASDLVETPRATGFSLLDPSRFRMSQSYSLGYFSGSGSSGSMGLYMNTIEYKISDPLTVRVGLAYLHQPLGFVQNTGALSELNQGKFLPNFSLEYRPSDRFQMLVDFRTVPSYGNSSSLNRYGYDPFSRSRLFQAHQPWHW
jgi:hypothetical protein